MQQDEYRVVAEAMVVLTNDYATANWWRRITVAKQIAELAWYRMPLIYSALIHHTAGMKAQRS